MVKFYESLDSQGRVYIRLNRRNGRILARWRNDMPNQTRYQFVRERKAVLEGYGELCYTVRKRHERFFACRTRARTGIPLYQIAARCERAKLCTLTPTNQPTKKKEKKL